jgi:hypothetical protein
MDCMMTIRMAALVLALLPLTACVSANYGEKPQAWCGWYMRQQVQQDPGEKFNRAKEWAKLGSPISNPEPGAIVVWRHHVGRIEQVTGKDTAIITSGNDGNQVRTRERSIKRAIALRRL